MSNNANQVIGKVARPMTDVLDALNIDWEIIIKGNHPKLRFDHKGRRRTLTFSITTSDHRAQKNRLSQLKRMLREG